MKPWQGKAVTQLVLVAMLAAALVLKFSGSELATRPLFHLWEYPVTVFAALFTAPFLLLGHIWTGYLKRVLEFAQGSGVLRWVALAVFVFGVLGLLEFATGWSVLSALRAAVWGGNGEEVAAP